MGLPPGEAEAGRGGDTEGTVEGTAAGSVVTGVGVVGPGVAGTGRVTVGACARPPPAFAMSRPQARRDCRAKRMMYYNTRGGGNGSAAPYFLFHRGDRANMTVIAA